MQERIPAYVSGDPDGMLIWFAEMAKRDLLFHPDDDPGEIVRIADGRRTFMNSEVVQLRGILGNMFREHGDRVYDAAHPIFMHAVGFPLDA